MRALILIAGASLALAACEDRSTEERYPDNQVVADPDFSDAVTREEERERRRLEWCRQHPNEPCPDQR